MRFTMFTLLLTFTAGGKQSRYHLLKCLSSVDPECVAKILKRGGLEKLMLPLEVPKGKYVTPEEIAGSDLMDFCGSLPDRFHFRKADGNVSWRQDHTGKMTMIWMIFGLKVLVLVGLIALQHFILKATLLAKLSLVVSGFLIFRALSHSLRKQGGLLKPTRPLQYPEGEPDLSGYGYMSSGG